MESNKLLKQLKDDIIQNDIMVKSLIKQIWECDTSEDLNHLNMKIAKQMHYHKTAIDELSKNAKESEKLSLRQSLEIEADGYRHQLEINSMSLRKANASAQKQIGSKAKDALLSGGTLQSGQLRHRGSSKMDKESLLNESASLTDNLQAVSRMLSDSVSQSEHTLHSLINSSATATEAQEEIKTMGNVIVYSRKILTKYGRREITDKVLIFLALAFFFACVLYVMMKRLF